MISHLKQRSSARFVSIATFLFFVAAPVVSAAHFLLIPHALDYHTGKTIHCSSHTHPVSPGESGHSEDQDHSFADGECMVLVLLHQAKTSTIPAIANVVDILLSVSSITPLPENIVYAARRTYLLSPSHSPPCSQTSFS